MTWSTDTSHAGAAERSARTPGLLPLGADGPRDGAAVHAWAELGKRRRLDHAPRVPRKRPRREREPQEPVRRSGVEVQPERRQHGPDERVPRPRHGVEPRPGPHAPG